MSAVPPTPFGRSQNLPSRRDMAKLAAREPLLHFLLLGGCCSPSIISSTVGSTIRRTIVVDATVDNQARQVFRRPEAASPTRTNSVLRKVWLDNGCCIAKVWRSGRQSDTAIRERVIFKALSIIDANVKLPPVDDNQLRAWFERTIDKYDEPARYDFQEAVLSGDNSETAVHRPAAALNAGTPGENRRLRVSSGIGRKSIVQSYGDEFAEACGSHHRRMASVATRNGWRANGSNRSHHRKPAITKSCAAWCCRMERCHRLGIAQRRRARLGKEVHDSRSMERRNEGRARAFLLATLCLLTSVAVAHEMSMARWNYARSRPPNSSGNGQPVAIVQRRGTETSLAWKAATPRRRIGCAAAATG